MIVAQRYLGTKKPPVGSIFDSGHSLATGMKICMLFNEGNSQNVANGGPLYRNYADPSNSPTGLNTNSITAVTTGGYGGETAVMQNGGGAAALTFPKIPVNGAGALSIFVRATEILNGITNQQPVLLGQSSGQTRHNGLWVFSSAGNNWFFTTTNASSSIVEAKIPFLSGGSTGKLVDICAVYDGANAILYGNGIKQTSSAQTGLLDSATTSLLMFADATNSTNEAYVGKIVCAMLWTRALNPAEVMSLTVSPYQMFLSPTRFGFGLAALPGGGSTVNMRRTLSALGTKAGSRQMHRTAV